MVEDKKLAWDCATGTGQCALALAEVFSHVIATDASQSQLDNAVAHDRIVYQLARAEQTTFESQSVDLITVAQAMHWFDISAFFKEVDRVLKPGGVLAVWMYNLVTIDPEIDTMIYHLYDKILQDYWPGERRLLEQGYAMIDFPFEEVEVPDFSMTMQWNQQQLLGYLQTWSAVREFIKQKGIDPLDDVAALLKATWGESDVIRDVHWPLTVHVRRKVKTA